MNTQESKTLEHLRDLWKSGNAISVDLDFHDNSGQYEAEKAAKRWIEKATVYFENLFYNSKFEEGLKNRIIANYGDYDTLDIKEALNSALGYIEGLGAMLKEGYVKDQFSGISNDASNKCFVAMCFDKGVKDIYTFGFKPAVEELGYIAVRVDEVAHNEKIDSKIFDLINQSRFLIADFTKHRNGVYYEAGYAKGIGLPVVQTCQQDEFENLHFDIKTLNTLGYANATALKNILIDHSEKSIGRYKPVLQERVALDNEIPF